MIASFFGVTIDELLSGEELLSIAEQDTKQKETHLRDLVFGLLDCSTILFFFLPLFGQKINGALNEVSLLLLTEIAPYFKVGYLAVVINPCFAKLPSIFLGKKQKYNFFNFECRCITSFYY